MVKIVGNKKRSMLIVLLLAAMQSFAVNVKGKISLTKVTTSRIPQPLVLGSHLRCVIFPYLKKLMVPNSW